MIWFSSDWHLNHIKIIEYDKRPFNSVEEMNNSIIDNCNKVVQERDTLYYLGDFAFALAGKLDKVYEFRDRIKCRNIHFILGNHDHVIRKYAGQLVRDQVFHSVSDVFTVKSVKPGIFLSHYAHKVWPGMNYPRYHLHGHSHGNLPEDDGMSFDVGINCNNYYPVSYNQVKERMSKKKNITLDHHR